MSDHPVSGGHVIGYPYQGSHKPGATSPASWESDNAVDIAVPVGTPVYAVADGTIGPQFGSLGSSNSALAGLRLHLNASGNSWYYAHLSKFAPGIRPGAKVRRGQLLGYSGSANGVAHLHIAQQKGSPLDLVKGLPGAVSDAAHAAADAATGAADAATAGLPVGCSTLLAVMAVCILLALVIPHYALGASRFPALDELASRWAGFPVAVECRASSELPDPLYALADTSSPMLLWAYTYVGRRPGLIVLAPLTCGAVVLAMADPTGSLHELERFGYGSPWRAGGDEDEVRLEGYALFQLTHELGHNAMATRNEGRADCFALAHEAELAQALGVPADRAAAMAVYGRRVHVGAPPAYHEGCP